MTSSVVTMVDIKAPPVTKSSVGIFSQIFATIFVVAAAGLVAFSFSADHWLEVTVKDFPEMESLAQQGASSLIQQTLTSDLTDDPMFTSYNRGLFETCYNILNETTCKYNQTLVYDIGPRVDLGPA